MLLTPLPADKLLSISPYASLSLLLPAIILLPPAGRFYATSPAKARAHTVSAMPPSTSAHDALKKMTHRKKHSIPHQTIIYQQPQFHLLFSSIN